MRIIGLTCLTIVTCALLFPGAASAQNAHFVGTPKASLVADGDDPQPVDLAVAFKEAGLGSNVSITYNVTATVSGSCACVTKNGNCPAAANKFPPVGVLGTATFSSGKNGTISQTIVAEEPGCQQVSPSTCPRGQTNTLVSVEYENIQIQDTTTPVAAAASPSTLGATFFTCP